VNVVWEFSQGTALPRGHAGVCMQLVAYWLSLMQYEKSENNEAHVFLRRQCRLLQGKHVRIQGLAGDLHERQMSNV
jgi:hypothetical protein